MQPNNDNTPIEPTENPVPVSDQPPVEPTLPIEQSTAPNPEPAQEQPPAEWGKGGTLPDQVNGLEKPPEPLIQKQNGKVIMNKRLKLTLWAVGAVSLVLLILVLLFFFLYNNPSYAVANSFAKVLSSESYDVQMVLDDKPRGQSATLVEARAKVDSAFATDTYATITLDNNRRNNDVDIQLITNPDSTNYIKFIGAKEFVDEVTEGDTSLTNSLKKFEPLVSGVNEKWIRVLNEDVNLLLDLTENKSLSIDESEAGCNKRYLETIRTDTVPRQELATLLQDKRPFTVRFASFENINGNISSKYTITIEKTFPGFVDELKKTALVSQLNKCTNDKVAQALDSMSKTVNSILADERQELKVDYWVNIFNHQPVKTVISYKSESVERSLELVRSTAPIDPIAMPKHDTRFEEIQLEVEDFFNTTAKDLQKIARDSERQRDTKAVASALETYYADNFTYMSPADLNQERMKNRLKVDEEVMRAPQQNSFSFQNAVDTKPQTPRFDQYIYQAMTKDNTLCDGGESCQKFVLWYRLEYDNTIQKIESYN